MSTELNNDYAQPFDALTDILSHVVVGNKNLVVSDGSGNLKPGFKSPMGMGPVQAERIFPSFGFFFFAYLISFQSGTHRWYRWYCKKNIKYDK